MRQVLLSPKSFGLTVLLLVAVTAFVLLGIWQWGRAHPTYATPASGGSVLPISDVYRTREVVPLDQIGVRIKVSGQYDPSGQLFVPDREQQGKTGYWVLTPLDVDGGGVMPVVRGWTPDASSPGLTPPRGSVTVVGRLEPSETDDQGPSDNAVLPDNQVGFVSSAELVSLWAPDIYYGFVILQHQQPPSALPPVPVSAPVSTGPISWQNFAYAIQWWLFAAFACFFWWRVLQADLADARRDPEEHDLASSPVPPELSEVRE